MIMINELFQTVTPYIYQSIISLLQKTWHRDSSARRTKFRDKNIRIMTQTKKQDLYIYKKIRFQVTSNPPNSISYPKRTKISPPP